MQLARTALVLGGGGLFGAYEVGVWKELEGAFRPDVVVGASIGALNGLAIAAGCPADEWIAEWMRPGRFDRLRLRFPRGPFDGWFDAAPLEEFARELLRRFQPKVPYGVALTSLWPLRTRVFWDAQITWQHLCASCGVPFLLRQYRLDGCWWADGGLLNAVPAYGAVEAGATRIVAVNILPARPWPALRAGRAMLHAVSRYQKPPLPPGVRVVTIEPGGALGAWRETAVWRRDNAAAWIERGRRDAVAALPVIESF